MKRLMKIANNNEYKLISEPYFTCEDKATDRGEAYEEDMNITSKKIQELNKKINKEMGSKGLVKYWDYKYDSIEEGIIDSIIPQFDGTNIITTVKATRELTDEELNIVKNNIIGQYSDGWGEVFEQFPYCMEYKTIYPYDDENSLNVTVECYCHLWTPSTRYSWECL